MKKIGILTFFYNSINYGAVLQAYALCKFLNNNGYDAEQISYKSKAIKQPESFWHKFRRKGFLSILTRFVNIVFCKINSEKISKFKKQKAEAFKKFANQLTPHTDKVFTNDIINETIDSYDVFITGSDQVWNGYNPVYYLDFVPDTKQKISYAPSISRKMLSDTEKQIFKKSLASFDGISVREKDAVELLNGLTETPVELVADPTLLLSAEDWESIAEERKIEGDYIFCYFLGDNIKSKKIVKKFAREKGLKTVFIQLTYNVSSVFDHRYGDIILNDVSPQQFLYLIKNAKYVFTDSFHAMVFSFLFKKQFFIFKRNSRNEMSSRITNIATYFKAEHRVCFDRESLDYINNCSQVDYEQEFNEFEDLKSYSMNYLLKSVEGKNNES